MNQLLLTLRLFATGAFFFTTADFMGVCRSTANDIAHRVTNALCELRPQIIKFPDTPAELGRIQKVNYDLARFPSVLGIIDGTHVKIKSPGGPQAETFRNRKGYFSINVQAIGNGELKFMDLVCRWQGSTPDVTIFNNSVVRARLENKEFGDTVILADSAYPLETYMLTPLVNPVTRGECRYNESQKRSRNALERTFGIWKRRFPILVLGTQISVDNVMKVILATAILHNILRDLGDDDPGQEAVLPQEDLDGDNEDPAPAADNAEDRRAAEASRHEFVQYFERLM